MDRAPHRRKLGRVVQDHFTKKGPPWVLAGGFFLAGIAGAVNAVGLMDVTHQGLTHVTGPLSHVATDFLGGTPVQGLTALRMVVAFFLGAVLSGLIIRDAVLHHSRRYGVALMLESLLLFAAAWGFGADGLWANMAAAAAAGLQNGLATSFSGAVVRTSHMTGVVTDLGINLGHALRNFERFDRHRFILHTMLFSGFLSGGVAAAALYARLQHLTLLFPAAAAGLAGLGYTISRQLARQRQPPSKDSQFVQPVE